MSRTFVARYPGRCDGCGERIHAGDEVKYDDQDVIHADCDESTTVERPAVICPSCWLSKPCGCEDDT